MIQARGVLEHPRLPARSAPDLVISLLQYVNFTKPCALVLDKLFRNVVPEFPYTLADNDRSFPSLSDCPLDFLLLINHHIPTTFGNDFGYILEYSFIQGWSWTQLTVHSVGRFAESLIYSNSVRTITKL